MLLLKGKGLYVIRVACDSSTRLINLWPLLHTSYPLPLSMLHFVGMQSYSYTNQRSVKTDVDQTGDPPSQKAAH